MERLRSAGRDLYLTEYFSMGLLYNVCFESVYAALEFEIIVVLSVMKYRKYVFASNT